MEKSTSKSSVGAQDLERKASSKSVFSGSLIDVFFKLLCIILGATALVAGILTGTWHNIMFAGMFYAIYWAIKQEEDK